MNRRVPPHRTLSRLAASWEQPDGSPTSRFVCVGGSPLTVRRPLSHVIHTARGRTGFLGLLALDGTLLEADETTSPPPERNLHDTLDLPFWDASWWSWSPVVQQRLRDSVALVAAGRALRYHETALVGRTRLITVDLAWAPLVRSGAVTALRCSAVDVTAGRPVVEPLPVEPLPVEPLPVEPLPVGSPRSPDLLRPHQ
jgi:hypothetical protein